MYSHNFLMKRPLHCDITERMAPCKTLDLIRANNHHSQSWQFSAMLPNVGITLHGFYLVSRNTEINIRRKRMITSEWTIKTLSDPHSVNFGVFWNKNISAPRHIFVNLTLILVSIEQSINGAIYHVKKMAETLKRLLWHETFWRVHCVKYQVADFRPQRNPIEFC